MNISRFDDLLLAAIEQVHAKRLLLVFTSAELPDDPTPEQRAGFEQGEGGALVPVMCVHQTPNEIGNFEQLKLQAGQFKRQWHVLFASSLSGKGDGLPSVATAEHYLGVMEESIKQGRLDQLIAFDANGDAIAWGQPDVH